MSNKEFKRVIEDVLSEADEATEIYEWEFVQNAIEDAQEVVPSGHAAYKLLEDLDTEITYYIDSLRNADNQKDDIDEIVQELEDMVEGDDNEETSNE